MAAPTTTIDWDAIEKLTDVIEAVQRVHLPFLLPIQQVALQDLEPYALAAKEVLVMRENERVEAAAAEAAKAAKEEADRIKKEEEANQPVAKAAEGGRRELPPLTPPPAR